MDNFVEVAYDLGLRGSEPTIREELHAFALELLPYIGERFNYAINASSVAHHQRIRLAARDLLAACDHIGLIDSVDSEHIEVAILLTQRAVRHMILWNRDVPIEESRVPDNHIYDCSEWTGR